MSIHNPEAGSQILSLKAENVSMAHLDKSWRFLKGLGHEAIDGEIDPVVNSSYGQVEVHQHGLIEVRPPLSEEALLHLSRELGGIAVSDASPKPRKLAA